VVSTQIWEGSDDVQFPFLATLRPPIGALVLIFSASPALADCKTPMPATVPIDQSAPNPQQSAFLGIWNGTVQGSSGPAVCERIAVQHVDADGSAKLIFANGAFSVTRGGGQPPLFIDAGSRELVGHIDNEGLHFTSQNGTVYLIKVDGSVTAKATSGVTGTGKFTKQ